MGFKDADWAYELDLPTMQKAVLVAICHRTDDDTHVTLVSHATIARMIGVNRSTVTTAVGVLERLGIIVRERRMAGSYRTSDRTVVKTTYVAESNVGESNVAETNVGLTGDLRWRGQQQVRDKSLTGQPEVNQRGPHKRGTRIPDPFTVTPDMVAWARERCPLVDGARSTERFINYFTAKTGRDATKLDWTATWRNWLLKDQQDAERAPRRHRTDADRVAEILSLPDPQRELSA